MADAEKAGKPVRRPRQIDRESNAYFGVVAMWRDGRLVVNASRKSYAIQYRGDEGKWITAERASHASLLAHSLIHWPELQAAALRLPELPTEAVTAIRQGTLPLTSDERANHGKPERASLRRLTLVAGEPRALAGTKGPAMRILHSFF